MNCPKCETPLVLASVVPTEQTLTFEISHEGAFLNAVTVGAVISNMTVILQESAKEHSSRVDVYVKSYSHVEKKTRIEFLVLATAKEPA
jgi:hypothetical protein